MIARYKNLIRLVACSLFLFCGTLFAGDQGVTAYTATTAQSPTKQGCKQVVFICIAFTGTIGNTSAFTAFTGAVPVTAVGDGGSLASIPYTATAGQLQIIEVR